PFSPCCFRAHAHFQPLRFLDRVSYFSPRPCFFGPSTLISSAHCNLPNFTFLLALILPIRRLPFFSSFSRTPCCSQAPLQCSHGIITPSLHLSWSQLLHRRPSQRSPSFQRYRFLLPH